MSPRIYNMMIAASLVFSAACTTTVTEESSPASENPSTDPINPERDPEPTPEPEACASESWDGSLAVGSGETCFVPVGEGQTLPLIAGPQFGYHIWMGVRCRDCGASEIVSYGVKDADGHFVTGQSLSASLTLDPADGYRHAAGIQAYMPGDGFEDPEYLGQTFTFFVEMMIDGETVSDEVSVVVDGIAYWSPPCDPDYGCNDGGF